MSPDLSTAITELVNFVQQNKSIEDEGGSVVKRIEQMEAQVCGLALSAGLPIPETPIQQGYSDRWGLTGIPCLQSSCKTDLIPEAGWNQKMAALRVAAQQKKAEAKAVPILPAAEPSEDVRWSKPDTPSNWAKKFGYSLPTFQKRCDDGSIRCKKHSNRSYQVAIADLPNPPNK